PRLDRLRATAAPQSRDRLRDRHALTTNIATGHLFTLRCGEVSEWLMVPLSKSGRRKPRGFESLPLRILDFGNDAHRRPKPSVRAGVPPASDASAGSPSRGGPRSSTRINGLTSKRA